VSRCAVFQRYSIADTGQHPISAPGAQVLVWGGSYGGYWLNRLPAVDAEVVDAALFESSTRGVTVGGAAENVLVSDEAGHRLFDPAWLLDTFGTDNLWGD
jgi:hypothetical protein